MQYFSLKCPVYLLVLLSFCAARSRFAQAEERDYTVATAPNAVTKVTWENLADLFQSRFRERSPARDKRLLAELQARSAQTLRLNPTLDLSSQAQIIADAPVARSQSVGLSQNLPFGTSLSAALSTDNSTTDKRYAVTLKQDLLRNGPLFAMATDRLTTLKKETEDERAHQDFLDGLYKSVIAFVDAGLAEQSVILASTAFQRAQSERTSVENLVNAGHKAKADLLISLASELRSRAALDDARMTAKQRQRDFELSMWQTTTEQPLQISFQTFPESFKQRLWSLQAVEQPPTIKAAISSLSQSREQEKLAWRDALPMLSLTGTFSARQINTAARPDKTLALNFSMPLISIFEADALRTATLNTLAAESQLAEEQAKITARQIEVAERILIAQKSLETTRVLLDYAKQTLEIERQKYADGKSTMLDLRRSQEDVEQAEITEANAVAAELKLRLESAGSNGLLDQVFYERPK